MPAFNLFSLFKECTNLADYINTKHSISYKIVDNVFYFEQTHGLVDWLKNLAVLPVPLRIKNTLFIVPLGFYLFWREAAPIVLANPVEKYVGYSHGGPYAACAAFLMKVPAVVFGCPNFMLFSTKKQVKCFDNVLFCKNAFDLVTLVPPLFRKGENKRIFIADRGKRPEHINRILWWTGHTTEEYITRMLNQITEDII